MKKVPNNNQFTAKDIERYCEGKMSPQERNTLEKAALEDPFLADAVEGYALAKTPEQDIAKLNEKLKKRISSEQGNNRPILIPAWLKVAALLLVVAGIGWLILNAILPQSRSLAKTDSDTPIINRVSPTTSNSNQRLIKQQGSKLNDTQNNNVGSGREVGHTQEYKDKSIGYKAIAGKHSIPPAEKQIEDDLMEKNRTTDSNLTHTLTVSPPLSTSPPTTAQIYKIENKRSESPARANTYKNNQNDLTPIQNKKELAGAAENEKSWQGMKSVIVDSGQSLTPVNGWNNLDDYFTANIKAAAHLHPESISGEVVLSFAVNGNGVPVNIKVDKSLSQVCDAEAVRLLKNGPIWRISGKKKGRIAIKF